MNLIVLICLPLSILAHSGVYIYHFPGGDGNWQSYDWAVLTNGTIYHDGVTTNAQGQISDLGGWPDNALATQAKKYNSSYHVCLVGDWETMLKNTTAQQTLINNAVNLVKTTGDGVNLDYEGMPEDYKTLYTTFVTNLANALHPLGKKLSLAVAIDINGWPGGLDDVNLAKVTDGLFYMGYDINWGSQQAYANAPLSTVEGYIQSSLDAGVPKNKIILGVPWYGYSYNCNTSTANTACYTNDQWPMPAFCYKTANTSATTYGAKWDDKSQTPYWEQIVNGKRMQGWYDNPQSTTLKYQYAKSKGLLGVGMWYAGCGDGFTDLWEALNAFV
jgi:spore germination protein YaaH